MKILRKKIIQEATENSEKENSVLVSKQPLPVKGEELEPVVDHTTAATLLSKEHNEKAAEENIKASGIEEVAKEVTDSIQDPKKDTPAPKTPSLKPYTEAKDVASRKELAELIRECKKNGRKYKISRSVKEGYRYLFETIDEEVPIEVQAEEEPELEVTEVEIKEEPEESESKDFFISVERQGNVMWIVKVNAPSYEEAECKALKAIHANDDIGEISKEAALESIANGEIEFMIDENGDEIDSEVLVDEAKESKVEEALDEALVATAEVSFASEPNPSIEAILVSKAHPEKSIVDTSKGGGALITFKTYREYKEFMDKHPAIKGKVQLKMHKSLADKFKQEKENMNKPETKYYDDEEIIEEALEDRPLAFDKEPENYGEDVTELVKTLIKAKSEFKDPKGVEIEVLNILPNGDRIIGKVKTDAKGFFADRYNKGLLTKLAKGLKTEELEKEVCPECGKEVCECDKKDESLDEAIVAPMREQGEEFDEVEPIMDEEPFEGIVPEEEIPAVELSNKLEVVPEEEITPEEPEEAEIEIDHIEEFEPEDEIGKKTMTTIKDAGEGAMFAFKDTLKDLFNLKIKVSDLQKLLSDSSDWLLDLLGFTAPEEVEIHPEEVIEPVEVDVTGIEELNTEEEPEPVNPITDLSIDEFDEVEPVEYDEEEDKKFFVGDEI